ncbi:AarF/ABC1/UbiB kinase family protein [Flavobacteriaceae bacterium R38]|nr:AarF/ABC1/UbiB kinase family protein [Flavobacteriaceae bacterium R38]
MIPSKLSSKKRLKRYGELVNVLIKYGFEDFVSKSSLNKIIPENYLKNHNTVKKNLSYSTFERVRMVLEELGPTYIKLGQIFSSRDDIIPPKLISELEKLQDNAPVVEGFDVITVIEQELQIQVEEHFQQIEKEPIATASMAQVHKAKLLDGEDVVLKIQKPDIGETIEADIAVMKQLVKSLEKFSNEIQTLNLGSILQTFEKSIRKELNFLEEIENNKRFAENFEDNESIYVSTVYEHLSTSKIICMEFIDGIKVSDIETLKLAKIDPHSISNVITDLYLEQVLVHGFFHSDPHPGNIMILPDSCQVCFIDFGMMDTVLSRNKEVLENIIIYFLEGDVRKISLSIENIAVKYDIKDYKSFELELNEMIDNISNTTLQNFKIDVVLNQFKSILSNNNIVLPDYLNSLIRGLILMEGVAVKLNPDYNITENLMPYKEKILHKRLSLQYIFKKNLKRYRDYMELIDNFPEDINDIIRKVKEGKFVMTHQHIGIKDFQKSSGEIANRIVFAIIIAALSIGSSILVLAKMPPLFRGIPLLGAIGFSLSFIFGIYIMISMVRNRK